ncbi:MAG: YbaB/EbfC family nucleoid-associated protein [Acidobacteria bacterium]|nr:YbaB/EbfC family nucleoid-associated protein [Acidobacteriota bacterium]MCZ6727112.1 YbaB/EbfC family nucleoid-associated protein [Acidobacteriota bacterium]
MNVRKLMQQAQKMQEQMERDLAQLEVGASVGGGMVQVKMNGHKQLLQVTIDSDAIDDDTSMLEDLVLVAVNEAARKVDEEMQSKMGGLAGALGGALPGL